MIISLYIILSAVSLYLFFKSFEAETPAYIPLLATVFLIVTAANSVAITNTAPLQINNSLTIVHYAYTPQTFLTYFFSALAAATVTLTFIKSFRSRSV